MEIFFRTEGNVTSQIVPFKPFLFLKDTLLLDKWPHAHDARKLQGEEYYQYLVFLDNWRDLQRLLQYLKRVSGTTSSSFHAPYYYLNDPVLQYLLVTGQTLFKGMSFHHLVRLQLDIETYCEEGYDFSNPEREADRIIVITLSDSSGWEHTISGRELDEKEMIAVMIEQIHARDPDIIEGHNIFNFDLNYIEIRAKRHKIPLTIGRGGKLLKSHQSRLNIAERTIAYKKFEVYGRHIVDTYLLAQMYDVTTRNLESYGLKVIARHFNVAPLERTYIKPEKINWYFHHNYQDLLKYALDDVRETRAISEILSQSFFYQAQIFPYSFQNIIIRGNATKIDSLFIREYINAHHSIPHLPKSKEYSGGYTDIFYQGIVTNILYCDIQSLYPSIILTFNYLPKKDVLHIFKSLLEDLKDFRLKAKQMVSVAKTKSGKIYFDALQSTFKILINSFYGYMGFNYGHFADFDAADNVSAKGRELIKSMVAWLGDNNCTVIEIDTDGIYFVPPSDITTHEGEEKLIQKLSSTLPPGINLELAGRYKAMFSYKIKNYVLLDYENHLTIKGSGLRSRGLELFQRKFMEEMFYLILTGKKREVEELLQNYIHELTTHKWDKKMFIKTETLQDSLPVYTEKVRKKRRTASASYELAIHSKRNYQPGDQISFYVTGTKSRVRVFDNCKLASEWNEKEPDENVEYYKKKLLTLYEKFRNYLV